MLRIDSKRYIFICGLLLKWHDLKSSKKNLILKKRRKKKKEKKETTLNNGGRSPPSPFPRLFI